MDRRVTDKLPPIADTSLGVSIPLMQAYDFIKKLIEEHGDACIVRFGCDHKEQGFVELLDGPDIDDWMENRERAGVVLEG